MIYLWFSYMSYHFVKKKYLLILFYLFGDSILGVTCLPVCWKYPEPHLQSCCFFSSPFFSFLLSNKNTPPAWSVLTLNSSWMICKLYLVLNKTCFFTFCLFSWCSHLLGYLCQTPEGCLCFFPLFPSRCPARAAFIISLNHVFFLYFLPLTYFRPFLSCLSGFNLFASYCLPGP